MNPIRAVSCNAPSLGLSSRWTASLMGVVALVRIPRAPDGGDCGIVLDSLMTRIADLGTRFGAVVTNFFQTNPLPMAGPSMTVESHQREYERRQVALSRVIQYARDHDCIDVHPELEGLL